jgi:hypothetical protein
MAAKWTASVGALFSEPGFVHGERSPDDFPAIEGLDRRLGLLLIAQLDKAKPFRASCNANNASFLGENANFSNQALGIEC